MSGADVEVGCETLDINPGAASMFRFDGGSAHFAYSIPAPREEIAGKILRVSDWEDGAQLIERRDNVERRAQTIGDLGLTNFEKFITIVCWWQPFVALISLFFGSAPVQLKRHAKWSVLTNLAIFVLAIVFGALFAGLGFLVAAEQGASWGVAIAGIFGFLAFIAALVNTVAVIAGRGPYFSSAGGAGSRFR